jgi:Enoyl-CoA hydratase/isomerase
MRRARLDAQSRRQLRRRSRRLSRRRAARAQALSDPPIPPPVQRDRPAGQPTICAAAGHVRAGALGLALACDLIIAAEDATFGTPEINVGVFPFMIMALIYRNVGRKKTNELLLLGRADQRVRRGADWDRQPVVLTT